MAIHWQVKFRSLRANTLYTVNIYDSSYSGTPVQLIGAAQPFETQEDDSDDMFMPVRTQSGYLRIVDTGYAADGVTPFNFRDLIPTTDTDRPVTLTDDYGEVVWQGFMQAQNFGSQLFETPQEREFPLQCSLTVTSCQDINYQQTDIQNFAYLLLKVMDGIPSVCRPTKFAVQGGQDAQDWLLKKIDWQNFNTLKSNDSMEARYNLYQILEEMCRFWGWTARTEGQWLYLTCIDDPYEQQFVIFSYSDLQNQASGTSSFESYAYLVNAGFGSDIYASVNNDDYQMRGPSKAIVSADINEANEDVINPFDNILEKEMLTPAWNEGTTVHYDNTVHYTKDVYNAYRSYWFGTCAALYAAFNVAYKFRGVDAGGGYDEIGNVIRIKKTYDGTSAVFLQTVFEHDFSSGFFRIQGTVYRDGDKYNSRTGGFFAGNATMKMRFGVGRTYNTALWWDGEKWVSTRTDFMATIGNRDEEIFSLYWPNMPSGDWSHTNILSTPSAMQGYLFIELLGSNDQLVTDLGGEKTFDIKDFKILFTKNNNVTITQFPNDDWRKVEKIDIDSDHEYTAKTSNNIQDDYSVDCIFASEGIMPPGYGVILNMDGSYFTGYNYTGSSLERPEQHLANRIINYWQTAKRKLVCDLRTGSVMKQTPRVYGTIDGTSVYPVSISHAWRDDVIKVVFMEI